MPPSINKVRAALPPFRNSKILIKKHQNTNDIIQQIIAWHNKYGTDYDCIFEMFDTGDIYSTCRGIWEFLKYNLTYDAESSEDQSIKSPSAILHPGEHIDCKHYSLFSAGILNAIKDNFGDQWEWTYRFASDLPDGEICHVFVVVKTKDGEIWIDPVLASFDQKKKWTYYVDKKPMSLYTISGTNDVQVLTSNKSVSVDKDLAWQSFLFFVQNNILSIRTLLMSDMQTTTTTLRAYCLKNGFDYEQLMRFLGI